VYPIRVERYVPATALDELRRRVEELEMMLAESQAHAESMAKLAAVSCELVCINQATNAALAKKENPDDGE
jgi:hypothetical protein